MDGPYGQVRPVIGSDGTIFAIDVNEHLYAISPDGGLKWVVQGAGGKGVAVGTDGSVYVGSEYAIRAFYPDGSDKWTFVQDPYAFILVGVSVGPDGNVYAVASEGMGVFSLTPAGGLGGRCLVYTARLLVDYNEIVFGANGGTEQLYFYANNHLRAVALDGTPVFSIPGGLAQLEPAMCPAIGPDGSVHTDLDVYSPDGSPLWSFSTPYSYNVFTQSDVGSDGVHYFGQNLSQLFALNPDGRSAGTSASPTTWRARSSTRSTPSWSWAAPTRWTTPASSSRRAPANGSELCASSFRSRIRRSGTRTSECGASTSSWTAAPGSRATA